MDLCGEKMETCLSVKNVCKEYSDGTKALTDISFDIKQGEFIAIIGPSGAGKSTLLRTLNQLVVPTSGQIKFNDREVTNANKRMIREVRREMGMIFQSFNLINRTSVLKNVLHGRLGYMSSFKGMLGAFLKEDIENAWQLLDRVGLADHAYKRADELSGGQRQRVAIARALAQKPSLILADEPIASLDPASSETVMNYLHDICNQEGISCLVNLHQVDVAKKYASRIIGVQRGVKVFDDKPDQLTDVEFKNLYHSKANA